MKNLPLVSHSSWHLRIWHWKFCSQILQISLGPHSRWGGKTNTKREPWVKQNHYSRSLCWCPVSSVDPRTHSITAHTFNRWLFFQFVNVLYTRIKGEMYLWIHIIHYIVYIVYVILNIYCETFFLFFSLQWVWFVNAGSKEKTDTYHRKIKQHFSFYNKCQLWYEMPKYFNQTFLWKSKDVNALL